MKKALIGLTLAGAAVLAVSSAQNETITLEFVRFGGDVHNAYLEPIIKAFEAKNPNIKISSTIVATGGYEAMTQKVLLGAAAGTPPDIAQVGYSFVRTHIESAGAVQLDDFQKNDTSFSKRALFPAMTSLGRVDKKIFMVPLGTSSPVLYINEDAFKAAGLDPNAPIRSWADTKAAATKLKAAGFEGILWGWSITGNWIFQAMLESAGGKFASAAAPKKATFQLAPGVKVMSYLQDLTANKLMPVTEDLTSTFFSGKLGMLVESSFQRVNAVKSAKFKWRMAEMPTPEGKSPNLPAGGNGVMMFAKDKARQQAAWKFLRFLTEPEPSRIVAENTGYTPANQSVAVEMRKKYAQDENFQLVLNQAPKVLPWHSWVGQNGPKISQVLKDMQFSVLSGRAQPKAALDNAAKQVNDLLK
jgi:multiple sugar transport system substrate-binding protein